MQIPSSIFFAAKCRQEFTAFTAPLPLGYDGGMEQNPYESPSSVKPNEPPPTEPTRSGGSRMDGPELFGVLVRAIGLYFILMGMVYVIQALFRLGGVARFQAFESWETARGAVEFLAGHCGVFLPEQDRAPRVQG